MWTEFMNMTLPALVGSGVTLFGLVLTTQLKKKKLNFEIEAAQDHIWMDLVKQSRIEYALQRKENNRLRYIVHHLQEEISDLEDKNAELMQQVIDLKSQT